MTFCRIARALLDPLNIGRVIARPFVGETPTRFERTGNRRDFSVPPPEPTLLDRLVKEGRVGPRRGQDRRYLRASGRIARDQGQRQSGADGCDAAGHGYCGRRRSGFHQFRRFRYGSTAIAAMCRAKRAALEAFDARLPEVGGKLKPGDLVILTADHGCDPTWRGTDHTRERVSDHRPPRWPRLA